MYNPIIQAVVTTSDNKELFVFGHLGLDLLSASWSLETDNNSSQASISIPHDKSILDQLLKIKPYQAKTEQPEATPNSVASPDTSMPQAKDKEQHIRNIVQEAIRQGVKSKSQIAYILATAEHESNFINMEEFASGAAYEGRSDIGNVSPGDGKRYKGRGYVQLTGRKLYQRYSNILGKDFINQPNLVKQDPYRTFILVHGMKNGSFTGVGLSDFTNASGQVDYYNARAIVNGDKSVNGASIANLAKQYENNPILIQALSNNAAPTSATDKQPQQIENPNIVNNPDKASKLLIRIGEYGALSQEFVYLISEVRLSLDSSHTITISAVSPLWRINQYRKTYTLGNITLKQLAERICKQAGLSLSFSGQGTEYIHLENNGLTDYQLLLREASRCGYVISNNGTQLVMKPVREGRKYAVDITDVLSFTSSLVPGNATPQSSGGLRGSWTATPKTATDLKAGTLKPQSGSKSNRPANDKVAKTSGIVKLENGKSVTEQQAQTELARVQDNPSQLSFIPRFEHLTIQPTDMLRIPGLDKFSGTLGDIEYWVRAVAFQYSSNGLVMDLGLYKPGMTVQLSQQLAGNGTGTSTPQQPDRPMTGSMQFRNPMIGMIVTSNFRTSRRPNHNGIDVVGSNNDILASLEGVVIDVETGCVEGNRGCGGGYGNLVIIRHANGFETLYAHLSSVRVVRGQKVSTLQKIGEMGNTGRSFGAHLHFEIKRNGQALNPMNLIK